MRYFQFTFESSFGFGLSYPLGQIRCSTHPWIHRSVRRLCADCCIFHNCVGWKKIRHFMKSFQLVYASATASVVYECLQYSRVLV